MREKRMDGSRTKFSFYYATECIYIQKVKEEEKSKSNDNDKNRIDH